MMLNVDRSNYQITMSIMVNWGLIHALACLRVCLEWTFTSPLFSFPLPPSPAIKIQSNGGLWSCVFSFQFSFFLSFWLTRWIIYFWMIFSVSVPCYTTRHLEISFFPLQNSALFLVQITFFHFGQGFIIIINTIILILSIPLIFPLYQWWWAILIWC